ncbi:hypothetical protein AAC387_Pa11g1970 [Persea americana]
MGQSGSSIKGRSEAINRAAVRRVRRVHVGRLNRPPRYSGSLVSRSSAPADPDTSNPTIQSLPHIRPSVSLHPTVLFSPSILPHLLISPVNVLLGNDSKCRIMKNCIVELDFGSPKEYFSNYS